MKAVVCLLTSLLLAGCGSRPLQPSAADHFQDTTETTLSPLKRRLLMLALQEWDYFGRQTVVYQNTEESIPHVGIWEDDDQAHSNRVNHYWQAVGQPTLTGRDCRQPWSAAFISWLMAAAGVPADQFPPAAAHWAYVAYLNHYAALPEARFVPHPISAYRPQPGDLICASRGSAAAPPYSPPLQSTPSAPVPMHCDLVVALQGRTLEAIGGNVRNSVSKSVVTLDQDGYLQPTLPRPWFLIIENRG